jgi:hypothetical protein
MLTIELAERLDSVLAALTDEESYFLKLVRTVSANMENVFATVEAIGLGGEALNKAVGQLHSRFAHFHTSSSEIDLRRLYQSVESLHGALSTERARSPEAESIESLIKLVDEFTSHYGNYLRARQGTDAAKAVVMAYRLQTAITDMVAALRSIRGDLWAEPALPEGFAKLSIVLSGQLTLLEIAQRLTALNDMYLTLATLSGEQSIEPLRVGKVETDSFWVWVAGKAKLIAVMSSLLQEHAARFHWNWRLYGVPRQADAIKAVLDLTNHLERAGIDVNLTRDELGHAAETLAIQLTTILETRESVTINKRTSTQAAPNSLRALQGNEDTLQTRPQLTHQPPADDPEGDDTNNRT